MNTGLKLLLNRQEVRIRGNANCCLAWHSRLNTNFLRMWLVPCRSWRLRLGGEAEEGGGPRAQPDPGLARALTPVTYIVLGFLWLPLTTGEGEKGRQDVKDSGQEGAQSREGSGGCGPLQCPWG